MECFEINGACRLHGARWPCTTKTVLQAVSMERGRQFEKYGDNTSHPDGTGPETRWLLPVSGNSAKRIEAQFREDYEDYAEEECDVTWVHLLREELAEAFMETDSRRLDEELVQLAALAVCWVEKIRERREWGVGNAHGATVCMPEWHSPADVMRDTHGWGAGPWVIFYRDPGGTWKEWE
jgi:hypothetical protein